MASSESEECNLFPLSHTYKERAFAINKFVLLGSAYGLDKVITYQFLGWERNHSASSDESYFGICRRISDNSYASFLNPITNKPISAG